jgi:hypothetical protein
MIAGLALTQSPLRILHTAASSVRVEWRLWIDELRLIKGFAAWTANFTPPTAPY